MKPNDIVILGVKHAVLAFSKATGERLWSANVAAGMSDHFVSVVADESRVFAHAGGKLYCFDLFSGAELWNDGLSGYGYGVGSLAFPGVNQSGNTSAQAVKRQASEAAAVSTT